MGERSSKPGRKDLAPPEKPGSAAPARSRSAPEGEATAAPNAAFDLWLERGLHKLFDTIAQEPIPDALLNMIEEDRKKR